MYSLRKGTVIMENKQDNQPIDDPKIYGFKYDFNKSDWNLFPETHLMSIVEIFNVFLPSGKCEFSWIDLKVFDKEKLINSIIQGMFEWHMGIQQFIVGDKKYQKLAVIGFELLFLIRGRAYSEEELINSDSYLRYDLIDMKNIEKIVDIFTMDAKLYGVNNWQKVASYSYYADFLKHFLLIKTNELYNSELGCLNIHQAFWNLIALMWAEVENGKNK